MYEIVRRHLGKVVAGAAMAVTGTAVAVAITLPGQAGADTPAGAARAGGSRHRHGRSGHHLPQVAAHYFVHTSPSIPL
ncbi:Tat pathway signal sequence domain protein, partial [Streptomyces sp. NPDC004288]